jgi:hypothetical protein
MTSKQTNTGLGTSPPEPQLVWISSRISLSLSLSLLSPFLHPSFLSSSGLDLSLTPAVDQLLFAFHFPAYFTPWGLSCPLPFPVFLPSPHFPPFSISLSSAIIMADYDIDNGRFDGKLVCLLDALICPADSNANAPLPQMSPVTAAIAVRLLVMILWSAVRAAGPLMAASMTGTL